MHSRTNISRRTPRYHDRNVYNSNEYSGYNNNKQQTITDHRLLFNSYQDWKLPNTSSFSQYYSKIYNIIEWIDNESSIIDKRMEFNEFNFIKNEFNKNFKLIEKGLNNLEKILKNDNSSQNNYNIYSQNKEKIKLINNEYNLIKKKINKNIFFFDKKFRIQQSKEKLLKGSNISNTDKLADEHSHLTSSKRLVNDALSMLDNVTTNLRDQSEMLKRTKKMLLTFMNKVGFSNQIMRTIQKRTQMDFILCIGGSLFVLIFIFILWYFFS